MNNKLTKDSTANEVAEKVAEHLEGKFVGDNGYSNNGLVEVTIDGVKFILTIRKV